MSRPVTIVVIRPEPGNAATIAALHDAGLAARSLPLFVAQALDWTPPDPAEVDALLFTSAQGVRLAGPALASLAARPVIAVGPATAAAARAAGLSVVLTGDTDAAAVVAAARAAGFARLLHLAGRDRVVTDAMIRIVYAAEPIAIPPDTVRDLAGTIVLLHSARAAARLAQLVEDHDVERAAIALVAISAKTAAAAGPGWRAVALAGAPRDDAMIAAARALTRTAATGISGA
ncbi:uroporphyrinogen-III synthase [Sphingomonas pseudosanguinis]|uniref:Uroporphyrinogen-III synthase n=1 Tax=Sphingomonas pseudosanguinis TaxID=413712 RepID=A0A7W6AB60_9SPHN|nr:uroporphyrinogen-III synthase [Sphingomonas pseudosanguinis]MBB3879470.1 uroporphyrinogen-III synthase [Sphingomonas pseudosanguinis]MBN3537127.1 uroporphyrinogen-III synthase [Sphingomonas pseudosanguinis]